MNNVIIGVGNCGCQIVKMIATNPNLSDVTLFAIDSVTSHVTMEDIQRVKYFSIQSDEKQGSGRSRERGAEMFKYHDSKHDFDEIYTACQTAKSPVIVITSGAGGTGSGSTPYLCNVLISHGVYVIPVIISPNKNDPDAFHLNSNDLFIELAALKDKNGDDAIKAYSVFENKRGDAEYSYVNNEVMNMIEIILGKKYDTTDKDSIDDSDLDTILNVPGRFIAASATGTTIENLKREIFNKLFNGFQPVFSDEDAKGTIVTAFSLKSMYADKDFKSVFEDINKRLTHTFDEYRNIVLDDNEGIMEASVIIVGLNKAQTKEIKTDYNFAQSMSSGIAKSNRPGFMTKKKASIKEVTDVNGNSKTTFDWGV